LSDEDRAGREPSVSIGRLMRSRGGSVGESMPKGEATAHLVDGLGGRGGRRFFAGERERASQPSLLEKAGEGGRGVSRTTHDEPGVGCGSCIERSLKIRTLTRHDKARVESRNEGRSSRTGRGGGGDGDSRKKVPVSGEADEARASRCRARSRRERRTSRCEVEDRGREEGKTGTGRPERRQVEVPVRDGDAPSRRSRCERGAGRGLRARRRGRFS